MIVAAELQYGVDQLFAGVSAFGAFLAACINFYAARHVADPRAASVYRIIALISLFYVGAWGWVALDLNIDRGHWSSLVTPVSMITFYVVFAGPALIDVIRKAPAHDDKGLPR